MYEREVATKLFTFTVLVAMNSLRFLQFSHLLQSLILMGERSYGRGW
jgi:hypothetical protein